MRDRACVTPKYHTMNLSSKKAKCPYDGTFRPPQIHCTDASCSGTAHLNDGLGGTGPFTEISGKWVAWSASMNSPTVPATVTGGVHVIDRRRPGVRRQRRDQSGRKLMTITRSAAGLPNAIATPLALK
jgi:hypothetical protein